MKSSILSATLLVALVLLGITTTTTSFVLAQSNETNTTESNTTMANETDAPTNETGNWTYPSNWTDPSGNWSDNNSNMSWSGSGENWTEPANHSGSGSGNSNWAYIDAFLMEPSGSFDIPNFITELATALSQDPNIFNATMASSGEYVEVSIHHPDAMMIADQATNLGPMDLTDITHIALATTLAPPAPTNATAEPTNETTEKPTSEEPTGDTNVTMEPTGDNNQSSMEPAPPTNTPAPLAHCSTFQWQVNCKAQSHCQEYNMTCVPKCSGANGNASLCDSWPHCWSNPAGDSTTCVTKCGALPRDNCFGSTDCTFYNDQCGTFCRHYGTNMDKCNADNKCMYDDVSSSCKTYCSWAVDAITCQGLIADQECEWSDSTKMCIPRCSILSVSSGACDGASDYCQVFARETSWQFCGERCDLATSTDACATLSACSWSNGACRMDCGTVNNPNNCAANPACAWNSNAMTCYTANCSVFGTDAKSCGTFNNRQFCTVGPNMMCVNRCDNMMMSGQEGSSEESMCNSDNACQWNSTTMTCAEKPCSATDNENDCSYRYECQWFEMSCVPSCYRADNSDQCASWSHCWWNAETMMCAPRCDLTSSKTTCFGANEDWFANPSKGPCFWPSDDISCIGYRCGDFNADSDACAQHSSTCNNLRESYWDTCIPICSAATTEMECMSPFYQSQLGCMWTSEGGCQTTCEYIADRDSCTGACMWNANFSVCTMQKMTTTSTTTPTPERTPAPTNESTPSPSSNEGSTSSSSTQQSGGDSSSSTTATGSSSQSTTSAATTSAPTTTAAVGNPRAVFAINQEHRANTTSESFKNALMSLLNLPSSALTVTYDESTGTAVVEFNQDATDSSGNALNATAEFEKAVSLDSTELASLGAASVGSAEPAPVGGNPAPEDDDGPDVAVIAGAAAGGFVFLLIILFIIKKQTSGGTGYSNTDDQPGDRPMLEVPQQRQGGVQL